MKNKIFNQRFQLLFIILHWRGGGERRYTSCFTSPCCKVWEKFIIYTRNITKNLIQKKNSSKSHHRYCTHWSLLHNITLNHVYHGDHSNVIYFLSFYYYLYIIGFVKKTVPRRRCSDALFFFFFWFSSFAIFILWHIYFLLSISVTPREQNCLSHKKKRSKWDESTFPFRSCSQIIWSLSLSLSPSIFIYHQVETITSSFFVNSLQYQGFYPFLVYTYFSNIPLTHH